MRMTQVTTVNWGLLPSGDVRLAEVTLLGGESGAGKSTFIDAVIGVMTGNEVRNAKYNSAQAETASSKKTKRSVASYVLGADDSSEPHRQPGAHGYAALYFEPDERDEGAGQRFTAIVGAEARVEKLANQTVFREIEDVRIIVLGAEVRADDLMSGPDDVIPVRDLLVALRKKFGKESVREFAAKSDYVCWLYGHLKGARSPVDRREAEGCMRAFVRSIAYRQPDDINALIRDDILEPDDNVKMIETLKTTITDVSNLRQQAERLEANVKMLEETNAHLNEAAKNFVEEWMFAALESAKTLDDAVVRRDEALTAGRKASERLAVIERDIAECDVRKAALDADHARLRTLIANSDADRARKAIEDRIARHGAEIGTFETKIRNAVVALSASRAVIRQAAAACSGIEGLKDAAARLSAVGKRIDAIGLTEMEGHFRAVSDGLDGGAVAGLQASIAAIDAAVGSGWIAEIDPIARELEFAGDALRQELTELRQRRDDYEARRRSLAAGRTVYPRGVEAFVAHLAEVLPESRPRILCDVVEMADPSWQNAVEGFIGGDRFAILYEPAYESRVIALLRSYRDAGGARPSVAQIGKALADAGAPAPGSLVGKLKSDDRVAMGYLAARYGRSVCVDTEEQLKDVRSGLLRDGVSVAGYNYRNRAEPDEGLVFGAEVRRRQAESLRTAVERTAAEIEGRKAIEEGLRTASRLMGRSKPAELDLDVAAFRSAGVDLRAARQELGQLDMSSIEGLENEAVSVKAKIDDVVDRKNELLPEVGARKLEMREAEAKAEGWNAEIEKLTPDAERDGSRWRSAMTALIEMKRLPFETLYRQEIESGRPVKSFRDRKVERRGWAHEAKNRAESALRDYNRDAMEYQKIALHSVAYPLPEPDRMAEWLAAMFDQVGDQIRRQRDTGLPEQKHRLEVAEHQFTKAFTSNFCQRVLQRVTGRDPTIDAINKSLEDISFSGDKIRMTQVLSPEYADYLDLFKAIQERNEVGAADLFAGTDLTPAQRTTMEALKTLLLSADVEHALRELGKIADYRNYKKYDFERTAKGGDPRGLSTWGTGSGGEAETPFYIIRAAVFAASFRLFSKQKISHFRTVFLDEVFQKMDETRTRRVLDFLTKEMGFQVICAAPTKSMAAVMDAFNRRISFSKSPAAGSLAWIVPKDLDQERIGEIYERHRRETVAEVQARFDLEDPAERQAAE